MATSVCLDAGWVAASSSCTDAPVSPTVNDIHAFRHPLFGDIGRIFFVTANLKDAPVNDSRDKLHLAEELGHRRVTLF
ncbi:MAG: hypothetical protein AAFV87_14460 [Pseudomonadota bacterium]